MALPEPGTQFNISEPTLKEFKEVVRAARASSAPGPKGVPYKVYKQCLRLLAQIWKILKAIWLKGQVAAQWSRGCVETVWSDRMPGAHRSSNPADP